MTSKNQADELDVSLQIITQRKLPKLKACLIKKQVEEERSDRVLATEFLDKNSLRRVKYPLWKCITIELREDGNDVSADFIQDLMEDNLALMAQDDIGITADLRKFDNYIEMIGSALKEAETFRDQDEKRQEAKVFLKLALFFSKGEKGILWLSAKLFLVSIAIAGLDFRDGGRFRTLCNLFYAKFLMDRFPCEGATETDDLLKNIRDSSIGKKWTLFVKGEDDLGVAENDRDIKIFTAVSALENQALLRKVRTIYQDYPEKAETYSRLAERRSIDASRLDLQAESLIEIGKSQILSRNLHNAVKSLTRALEICEYIENIHGVCEAKMHLSAAKQRLGETETAVQLLTEMGALAIKHREQYQLARALQLLGELHLRNDMPDLATQHLYEAFNCFMGLHTDVRYSLNIETNYGENLDESEPEEEPQIYRHEGDHTRFLMAVAAGQQHMASFYDLLNKTVKCNVARIKAAEFKSLRKPWWSKCPSYELVPCTCSEHQTSVLDIVRKLNEQREIIRLQESVGESVEEEEDIIGDNADDADVDVETHISEPSRLKKHVKTVD